MINTNDELYQDFEAVRNVPVIPTMLEVICNSTGLRFATVARVTKDRWLACRVADELNFNLKEGDELEIATTICREVRCDRKEVVIDNVQEDAYFHNHHTPKLFGFKSYISYPIILKNGEFFGTLCALDTNPANIDNKKVRGLFSLFADLLSFYLQNEELMDRIKIENADLNSRNEMLEKQNSDLDSFVYATSHDLKSPISNVKGLLDALSDAVQGGGLDKNGVSSIVSMMKESINRLDSTINDLTTLIKTENVGEDAAEPFTISSVVYDVKQDLGDLLKQSNGKIIVSGNGELPQGLTRNAVKGILYNLLSNGIKYRSPERTPEILVNLEKVNSKVQLVVKDNGLGIPPEGLDKLFTKFKRFHDHVEGTGMGLFIVRRMVERCNGTIKVESTLGVGTTFTIVF